MKKKKMILTAVVGEMAVLGATAAKRRAAQPLFQGNGDEYKVFDRYVNMKLTAGGKRLVNSCMFFFSRQRETK